MRSCDELGLCQRQISSIDGKLMPACKGTCQREAARLQTEQLLDSQRIRFAPGVIDSYTRPSTLSTVVLSVITRLALMGSVAVLIGFVAGYFHG